MASGSSQGAGPRPHGCGVGVDSAGLGWGGISPTVTGKGSTLQLAWVAQAVETLQAWSRPEVGRKPLVP